MINWLLWRRFCDEIGAKIGCITHMHTTLVWRLSFACCEQHVLLHIAFIASFKKERKNNETSLSLSLSLEPERYPNVCRSASSPYILLLLLMLSVVTVTEFVCVSVCVIYFQN